MLSEKFANGLVFYLGFLIAITFYQATLAYVAKYRGDVSYITTQRASFVPFVHMELLGTFVFPLLTIIAGSPVVFGWPKPFHINSRYFKRPKRDINIIYSFALLSLFLMSGICMLILKFMGGPLINGLLTSTFVTIPYIIQFFLSVIGQVCMTIGALFLLPMPGTAGWYLLLNNASYEFGKKMMQASFMISIAMLFLILSGVINFYFRFFLILFLVGATP